MLHDSRKQEYIEMSKSYKEGKKPYYELPTTTQEPADVDEYFTEVIDVNDIDTLVDETNEDNDIIVTDEYS